MKKNNLIKSLIIESPNVISDLKMYTECMGFTLINFYTSLLGKKRVLLSDGRNKISLEEINLIYSFYKPRKYFEVIAKTYDDYEDLVEQLENEYKLQPENMNGFLCNYCLFNINGLEFRIISKEGILDAQDALLLND